MATSNASCAQKRSAGGTSSKWGSPHRTMVWTEPKPVSQKVAVVYYLCNRNGQLEHPHFMEVPLSSSSSSYGGGGGLYLRDFTDRLNMLRGNGMANMYSWSSKRSYKNGFVWHDLTEDDLIRPAYANEYVLKGSQLPMILPPHQPRDVSASSSNQEQETTTTRARARADRRKNWSSFDLGEYKVALRTASELSAADAATQTDDRRPRDAELSTELAIDEISSPPSSSSPDTLETLISNDVRVVTTPATHQCEVAGSRREVGVIAGGRMRASAVLMQFISCGSITVKDRTAAARLPRGRSDLSSHNNNNTNKEEEEEQGDECLGASGGGGMAMERDYFSGSLVETKKQSTGADVGALKRSSSCNADRGGAGGGREKLAVAGGVRARCVPRMPAN